MVRGGDAVSDGATLLVRVSLAYQSGPLPCTSAGGEAERAVRLLAVVMAETRFALAGFPFPFPLPFTFPLPLALKNGAPTSVVTPELLRW